MVLQHNILFYGSAVAIKKICALLEKDGWDDGFIFGCVNFELVSLAQNRLMLNSFSTSDHIYNFNNHNHSGLDW